MNSKKQTQVKISIVIIMQISLIIASALIISSIEYKTSRIGNSINVVGNMGFLSEQVKTEIQKYSLGDSFNGNPSFALSDLKDSIESIKNDETFNMLELEPIPSKFHKEWDELQNSFQKFAAATNELSIIHDSGNSITDEQMQKLELVGDELQEKSSVLANSLSGYSQDESFVIIQTLVILAIVSIIIHIFLIFLVVKSLQKYFEEKIELEIQLVRTEENLKKERFSAIGKLASRLAHDMRNPLSVIKNTLENLKMKKDDPKMFEQSMERCDRAINRIAHQIDEVMEYLRKQPLRLNNTKVSDVITDALDSIYIPNNIMLKLPKNDTELKCDTKKLSVAFVNLILNGIQSIEGKGVLEIKLVESTNEIIIQVQDSGKGIPEENLDRVFEPLFTTKQQGTGLGLASVKSIIDAHGGTISVTSPPSIFTMRLPKISD